MSNTHIQIISFFYKILYVFLLITDYLIRPLGLSDWALVCDLEWDQKRTYKTLTPMGLGPWAFLSTLNKSKVTINYIYIVTL